MGKFKKLLTLSLIFLLSSTLISCKSAGQSLQSKNEEIVLNFPTIWSGKDSKAKMVEEIVSSFNKQNSGKIKVNLEGFEDYDTYNYKMRVNVAANTLPDIFTFKGGAEEKAYYRTGKLMDLTGYMDDNWKGTFISGEIDKVKYDNKILSIPFELGVAPVIYNKTLLEKVGVTTFPKNYTEFFAMLDKLKASGITPMSQMTGANAWTSMLWYSQIVASIGGQDVYKRGLDDPAFLEAARVLKRMFSYTTANAVGATAAQSGENFLKQNTAIFMNGPWYIGTIKSNGINNLYDYVDVAPAPQYEGGKGDKNIYIGFTQAYIGAAKQKDKAREEAVIKFLKYFTSPENVKKITISSGALFNVKIDTTSGEKLEKLQNKMSEQASTAPYMVSDFIDSVKPEVGQKFPQALTRMVLSEITPEQFIEELKNAAKE